MTSHDEIYRAAELYDIAFDFRDVAAECEHLLARCAAHGRPARSFLELAAGPAMHATEMARRGVRAAALDRAATMVRYGQDRAARAGVEIQYHQGDMRAFAVPERHDLAVTLMNSASYLLDNAAVLRHLDAVADALEPGGLYVVELGHPRDIFGAGRSVRTQWEAARDGTRVRMTWGDADDPFDPITQVTQTATVLEWWRGEDHGVIRDAAPQRCFTHNEFDALVRASGRFDVVEVLGAMTPGVPFSNEKAAWRMVPVLRRRGPS